LKRDAASGTYQVYVAGTGVTGDQLCSNGLYTTTRPAISRDGKIVTFWACNNNSTDKKMRAFVYTVNGGSGPVTTTTAYTTALNTGTQTEWWPPQSSNVDESGHIIVLFVDRNGYSVPMEANCTAHSGNNYWKTGQLYSWNGTAGGGVTIVSTASHNVDGCAYLVTQGGVGDNGNIDSAAAVDTYTISNDGTKYSWSAKAINQMSGVSQNDEQIIHVGSGGRVLISKNTTSGTEGDDDSHQQTSTGGADYYAFSSKASNLTSASDANGLFDIFRRQVSGSTIAAYTLSLNNSGSNNDGPSYYPYISGDANYVAFFSNSMGLVSYYSTSGYSVGTVPFCFLSRFSTSPGTVELTSYKYNDTTDWRTGVFPTVDYDASHYGFHSIEGDCATSTQSGGVEDLYELTGFS